MDKKRFIRIKYFNLRKKKYFNIEKYFFTPLIKLLKSKKKNKKINISLYYPSSYEVDVLKIIDLKSENLCPYIDDDIVVSYNGEIYNYIELKKELIKLKWKFKTNSDLEVLVKSWKQWGFKIFEKLNGMFAFCIYEKKKNV